MQGTIVSVEVSTGEPVAAGQALLVMESMKMEHVVTAPASGIVRDIRVAAGDADFEGHVLVELEPAEGDSTDDRMAVIAAVIPERNATVDRLLRRIGA